jgi:colanic acid biosynthesis glycosyl transferase WcaI
MDQIHPRVTLVGLNYQPEPTGIAPYTSGLATGLAKLGWDVRAITAFPHYPAWKIAEGYRGHLIRQWIEGVRVTRLRPYMPKNPSGLKRAWLEVGFGLRAAVTPWGRPKVVILVSPALFATAVALVRARLTPGRPAVVVWVQDLYSLGVAETGALGDRGSRVMKLIEGAVFRRADSVVVIHDRFRRYVTDSLGVRPDAVEVVRNWTHIRSFAIDRKMYRARFNWGSDVIVLHAGNMGAKQALENVVAAAQLADAQDAHVRFVLLGNGNQRDALELMSLGVSRIEFLDSLSDQDFQGAMAAADILLVNEKPGVAEMAVPSKLTSYFSAMRPVIVATDSGSISAQEIENAGAGVRVDAGDPHALLLAALDLGRDLVRSEAMGASGKSFQEKELSESTAISHYAEIIKSLTLGHRRSYPAISWFIRGRHD